MDNQFVQEFRDLENKKENYNFVIHLNLLRKYDEDFNYIYASPIRRIVRNREHYETNITYKDSAILAEDIQFMRREYHLVTQTGKKQIQDRIKLLGDFYGRALVLRYEYPMMLLTRNEDTFRRRLRRMRKMVAADGSSDDSDDGSINFDSFSTLGFLNHLDSMKEIQEQPSQELGYERGSLDSSVHDIYENTDLIVQMEEKSQIYNFEESELSHLICDVRDVDYEKTIQAYKIIQQNQKGNKLSDFSNLNKLLKKEQLSQGTILVSKPLKNRLQTGSFEPWQQNKPKQNLTKPQKIGLVSYHNDREGKKQKKQKIRDKAAALLNRVQSHNYTDYSKYISENTEVDLNNNEEDTK